MEIRHSKILDLLNEQGDVSVSNLSSRFGVSEITIRRDLTFLEQEGHLIRTHGGAVLAKRGVVEFAFAERAKVCAVEKKLIARVAAKLIEPGMAVIFDTGTTTLEVAKLLIGIQNLTVLTSSLAIAGELYAYTNIELVLLGGNVRRGSPDLRGPLTEQNLKQFRANIAIIGTDGASEDGIYTPDLDISKVSQVMIASAQEVVLVTDSSKFGKFSFAKYASWSDIDHVITDSGVPANIRKWLDSAGPQITYIESNGSRA